MARPINHPNLSVSRDLRRSTATLTVRTQLAVRLSGEAPEALGHLEALLIGELDHVSNIDHSILIHIGCRSRVANLQRQPVDGDGR